MALNEYSVVAMAIEKMDSKLEKLSEDVSGVRIILAKQDVLLEKIINLEANSTENNKRIHHRINEIVNGFDTRLKALEGNGKKIWEVARNKAIEWAVVFVILAVLMKFGVTK